MNTIGIYSEKPIRQTISVMSLCLQGLITAELIIPGSTDSIADEIGLNKQMLGHTVTSLTAFFTMLLPTNVTRKTDRGMVILFLSVLLVLSNILIVIASNPVLFFTGRFLLGIVAGSFSVMCVTTLRALGSEKLIEKSFSVIFALLPVAGGVILVLGSVLEEILGRSRFYLLISVLVILSFFSLLIGGPNFTSKYQTGRPTLIDLWTYRPNRIATLVVVLLFGSQFSFIIYLSPFVESIAGAHPYLSSVFLMTFVVCHFLGSRLSPLVLKNSPYLKLILLPAVLACLLWALAFNERLLWLTYLLVVFIGFLNGPFTIGWAKWLTQNFSPNGNLLLLAVIQLSIFIGSGIGGMMAEVGGVKAVLTFSGFVLLAIPLCILAFCSAPSLNKRE